MSDYLVHGKKGNGKSLVCVGRLRDAIQAGKPVATNLDIRLDKLTKLSDKTARSFRLPDRPSIADMEMIGRGSDSVDESTFGVIVLDEMATWMNTRNFQDKGRQALLDWFVHSRKLGWDVYFICQSPEQIDKQVRNALSELSVSCKRLDKIRIPFIGSITKNFLGFEIRPPKIHVATVRYGMDQNAVVSDRWTYRGRDLYKAYDTNQVFKGDYAHGLFMNLPAWHQTGRYETVTLTLWQRVKAFFADRPRSVPLKPKMALVKLLMALPEPDRIRHWKRLNEQGAFA